VELPKPSAVRIPEQPPQTISNEPVAHIGKHKHRKDLDVHDADDEWDDKDQPANKNRWIFPRPEDTPMPEDDDDEDL